jgi:hypothetical protein
LFSWGWASGNVWALIERIHNDVYFSLLWKFEDIYQAFHKRILAGLSGAIIVVRIKREENLREFTGSVTELDEERRQ